MTREKAINVLEDALSRAVFMDDIDVLEMAIAALREQPQWISVEKRLPEVGKTVLTLDKHGHIHDRYMYRCDNGVALFTAEYLVTSKDITHWMPLPPAPEVKG